MTINTTTASVTYTGNGSTRDFPVTFKLNSSEEVLVTLINVLTEEETTLDSSEYGIAEFTAASTTTITYPLGGPELTSDYQLRIERNTSQLQLVNITNQTRFDASVVMGVWDKLHMLIQEMATVLTGTFRVSRDLPVSPLTASADNRKDTVVTFNATGTGLELGPSRGDIEAAGANAATATAAAAAALIAQEAAEAAEAAITRLSPKLFGPFVSDGTVDSITITGVYPNASHITLTYDGVVQFGYTATNDGTNTTLTLAGPIPDGVEYRIKALYQVAAVAADAEEIILPNGDTVESAHSPKYATRTLLVADIASGALDHIPQGGLAFCSFEGGTLTFKRVVGSTSISDMPGWLPTGMIYPDNWKENTTPDTTNMTAALQSAVSYGDICDVHLAGYKYLISDVVTVTARAPAAQPEGARLIGVDPNASVIVQSDPSKDWIKFEAGGGNGSGWIAPHVRNIGFITDGATATQSDTGAGLHFVRCLNGLVENCMLNGPTYHYLCENVGQMRWSKNVSMHSRRADNTLAVWKITTNDTDTPTASPRCFGNYISDCESFQGNDVEAIFDLEVTDGLHISNCHFNNGVKRFHIHPDGSNYRDTVKQVFVTNTYFDGNGSPEDGIVVSVPSGPCAIEGIYMSNSFMRVGTGSVLRLGTSAGDVAGLSKLSEIHFTGCEFRQFDGKYVELNNANITAVDVIEDIRFVACTFQDGPAGGAGASGNPIGLDLTGNIIQVADCTFYGDWEDAGGACVSIGADTVNWQVSGCIFDVGRAAPVSVDPSAGEGQSYGHTYTDAPVVVQVAEEGTNADGYYRKYADGRIVCRKTVTFTSEACTTAYGSLYRSVLKPMGDWPLAFTSAPTAPQYSLAEVTSYFGLLGGPIGAATATAAGSVFLAGPTSTNVDFKVSVFAEGY